MIDKMVFFAQCLDDEGVAQVYVRTIPGPDLQLPAGVELPIMLEYGWNMPIQIPDLKWTARGITATLSFNQTPHKTFVPWDAVVAISPRGQGVMVSWEWYVPSFAQSEVTRHPIKPQAKRLWSVPGDGGK